jgi:hypothetical protein
MISTVCALVGSGVSDCNVSGSSHQFVSVEDSLFIDTD